MRQLHFNATVSHKPDKKLVIANALLRNPIPHSQSDLEAEAEVKAYVDAVQTTWPVTNSRLNIIKQSAVHDPEMQQNEILDYVLNGWPRSQQL